MHLLSTLTRTFYKAAKTGNHHVLNQLKNIPDLAKLKAVTVNDNLSVKTSFNSVALQFDSSELIVNFWSK